MHTEAFTSEIQQCLGFALKYSKKMVGEVEEWMRQFGKILIAAATG